MNTSVEVLKAATASALKLSMFWEQEQCLCLYNVQATSFPHIFTHLQVSLHDFIPPLGLSQEFLKTAHWPSILPQEEKTVILYEPHPLGISDQSFKHQTRKKYFPLYVLRRRYKNSQNRVTTFSNLWWIEQLSWEDRQTGWENEGSTFFGSCKSFSKGLTVYVGLGDSGYMQFKLFETSTF